ncbi:MAG: beta strand repeat-containing protein, partial [Blastocatellia bacterium]
MTEKSQWNVRAEQHQGVWKDWLKERTPLSSFVAPSLTIAPKLSAQAGVTFTVNSTADTVDANIGNGICATAAAVCTLRAALAEANATPAADIINITATGTIELSTALPEIVQSVTINGPGANLLTVRRPLSVVEAGTWWDPTPPVPVPASQFRIFHIPVTYAEIVITGMTISHGSSVGRGYGGNIYSRSKITVSDCELLNGAAGKPVFTGQTNPPTRSGGGAIAIDNADATIERVFIMDNMSRVHSTLQQHKDSFGAILFLASGETPRTLNVRNATLVRNITNETDVRTGGTAIQVYAEAGAEVTTNLTNLTLWNDANCPPLGSHIIGAGTKSTYRVRNTYFSNNQQGNYFFSTADGALTTDNQIISLGNNMVDTSSDRTTTNGNTFLNAPGDIKGVTFQDTLYWRMLQLGDGTKVYYGGASVRGIIPLPGSPAIDAGSSVDAPATDARGVPRDGTYGPPDIGAIESKRFTMVIDDGDNQSVAPNSAFPRTLSVTVTPNDPSEPVDNGRINFTPPASGAGASITGGGVFNPTARRITITSGKATTGTVTANGSAGSYVVLASASGVTTPRNFNLSNVSPFSVNSITLAGTSPTTASTLTYTVTFSESATGGAISNFELTGTGLGDASIASVTGSGSTRTVTVNRGTATGSIALRLANSTGLASVPSGFPLGNLPFTSASSYSIAPRVVSIARVGPNPPTGSTVSYLVTFSESVTGAGAASNFLLTSPRGSSLGTAAITGITGSGTTRTVTVDLGTATGSIGLNMVNGTGMTDSDNNPVGGLPFNTGEMFTAPPYVVSVTRDGSNATSSATVSWTVTFSSSVTGGALDNFELVGTSITGATITGVTGSGTTRTVTANVGQATGTLGLSVVNSTGLADGTGNALGRLPFTQGESFSIAPRVVSITRVGPNPPTGSTVSYLVTFSESVTGGAASNFALAGSSLGSATIAEVTGTGATRTVSVNLGTAGGALGLSMVNSTGMADNDSNPVGGLPYTASEVFTLSATVVSILRAPGAANPTSSERLVWTITFSGPVTGLSAANFALTGSAGASITSVSGSGSVWTIEANPGMAAGTVGLSMTNSDGVTGNTGSAVSNLPFVGEESFTIAPRILSIDQMSPNPVAITGQANPVGTMDVLFDVHFNESVTGMTEANFELIGSSAAQSSITGISGSGMDWRVTVRVGGTGMVALRMKDSTGVRDTENHPLLSLPYTSPYYLIAPRVLSIAAATANPSPTQTASYTVTFSEEVTGLTAANFALTVVSGPAGAAITSVSGSGTTWTVGVNFGASTGRVALRMATGSTVKDSDDVAVATSTLPFAGETFQIMPRVVSLNVVGG